MSEGISKQQTTGFLFRSSTLARAPKAHSEVVSHGDGHAHCRYVLGFTLSQASVIDSQSPLTLMHRRAVPLERGGSPQEPGGRAPSHRAPRERGPGAHPRLRGVLRHPRAARRRALHQGSIVFIVALSSPLKPCERVIFMPATLSHVTDLSGERLSFGGQAPSGAARRSERQG